MSDGRAKGGDLTYSVGDEVTGSSNLYEVLDNSTPNPAYGCTTLEKVGKREGPHPNVQHGPVYSYQVNTNKERKKANARPIKNEVLSVAYLIVLLVAILIATGIAIVMAFVEISKLHVQVAVLQSTSPKKTETIQALENSIDVRLSGISIQLNISELNFKKISNSISIQQSIIDILSSEVNNNTRVTEVLTPVLDVGHVFASCVAIQKFFPFQPSSGYYKIRSSNGSTITAYCDMTRSCGDITGGWMRVAELDMTDNTTQCPDSLELRTSPLSTCRIGSSSNVCSSDIFNVYGVEYTKVCGRVKGYQVGTTDAFGYIDAGIDRATDIDTYYVDGVSLTHGSSPRQHIWTFASVHDEDDKDPNHKCPCINTPISSMIPSPPTFVGNDYFCDCAVLTTPTTQTFHSDPLWDGASCGPQSTCCSFNSPPWFYKQLPQTTTDDIEMRVCCDQRARNEDIAIEIVELYVQ